MYAHSGAIILEELVSWKLVHVRLEHQIKTTGSSLIITAMVKPLKCLFVLLFDGLDVLPTQAVQMTL